jgi:hypothetical protein
MAIRFALLALAAAHRTVQVDEHCAYKDSPGRGANASPPGIEGSRWSLSRRAIRRWGVGDPSASSTVETQSARIGFYRVSAGLHQLTGDFFRSSSFVKKSTPGDISAIVVPFKKALLQLCVLQLPAHVTHSPVWTIVSQAQIAFDVSAGSTVHFALRHSARGRSWTGF